VAVRLPPFWVELPAVWFAQAEAQFFLAGISIEATKFHHVISQLDQRYAAELEDVITSPPERDPYTLRTELIRRLSPLERATYPPVPYSQDGRPQAVPVPEAPQESRPRCARRFPPHHLVQPATPQRTGHSRQTARGQLGRRSLQLILDVAPQLALDNTALLQGIEGLSRQVVALNSEQDRLRTSLWDPRLSSRDPSYSTRDPTLSPGTAVLSADPPPEMTLQPPSAGIIAASQPERKSVLHPAPTASRENQHSRQHRRHMSALQRQAASSLWPDLLNGNSWSTRVLTYACTPAGSFRDARNAQTTTSMRPTALPSTPMDGSLVASTLVYAGISRGGS
jgi:hypothetical protein